MLPAREKFQHNTGFPGEQPESGVYDPVVRLSPTLRGNEAQLLAQHRVPQRM
jgi:hypothetical protein